MSLLNKKINFFQHPDLNLNVSSALLNVTDKKIRF